MTREEALGYFKRRKKILGLSDEVQEAEDMAIKALEQEPILCKECENYYFADNRTPEQQCYVCDYWDEDNPEPTGFCNHAVKKARG